MAREREREHTQAGWATRDYSGLEDLPEPGPALVSQPRAGTRAGSGVAALLLGGRRRIQITARVTRVAAGKEQRVMPTARVEC